MLRHSSLIRIALLAILTIQILASKVVASQGSPDVVWTTNAHSQRLISLTFNQNTSLIGSGSYDETVKVLAVSNAFPVRSFILPQQDRAFSLAFSPDGALIACGTDYNTVNIWNLADGSLIRRGAGTSKTDYSVSFSADSQWIAIGKSEQWINIASVADPFGGRLFYGHESDVYGVQFSPDGILLASASRDMTAKFWRASDGAILRNLTGHSNAVNSVNFSADGSTLATASSDGTVRLWRVSDGTVLRILDTGPAKSAQFSGTNVIVVLSLSSAISFWRVSDGTFLHSYDTLDPVVMTTSLDGKYFAYGRDDGAVILARMPLIIDQITRSGNEVTLRWQGGSGLYQLQARNDLSTGQWQDVGNSTTNTAVTHSCLSPIFFRVQSLPNP